MTKPLGPLGAPSAALCVSGAATGGSVGALCAGPQHHYHQQRAPLRRDQRKASQSSPLAEAAQSCSVTGILVLR